MGGWRLRSCSSCCYDKAQAPRPGTAFRTSSNVYNPTQRHPSWPDPQGTQTRGHPAADTPTRHSHACIHAQTLFGQAPTHPHASAPAVASWNLESHLPRIPGSTTFSAVPPAPTHCGLTLPGRLLCLLSLSQHCLSPHGDLEPPHRAEHRRPTLPHTIPTCVTLEWSLSLSGPHVPIWQMSLSG